MHELLEARAAGGYRLWLRFADGTEGIVDLEPKFDFVGVFAPLVSPEEFAAVRVNPDDGSVEWPGAAALDAALLYTMVKQSPGAVRIDDDASPEDLDETDGEDDE